jgi:NitT/TauT family transport system substrate-binding protein
MRNRPTGPLLISTFAMALLLAACTGASTLDGANDPATEPVMEDDWEQVGGPVVLLRTPFLGDAAFAIAIAEGWFEEAGIEIEVVEGNSPADVFGSIVAGDIDVSYFAPNGALFTAAARSAPIRVVASASVLDEDGCDYLSIVGTLEAAQRIASGQPEQLRGLRLAGSFRSLTTVRFLDGVLAEWGTSADEGVIEVIAASQSDFAVLLGSGQVDLAIVYEPSATLLKETVGAVHIIGAPAIVPDELTSVYVFSERLLQDRELGARVLAVYLRGAEAYRDGPTERNVAILSEQTGIEPDLLSRMCWATLDPDGRRYEAVMEDAQRTAILRGDIDAVVPAGVLWDHFFQDRARELLSRER